MSETKSETLSSDVLSNELDESAAEATATAAADGDAVNENNEMLMCADVDEDAELAAMQKTLQELEDDIDTVSKESNNAVNGSNSNLSTEEKGEVDARSVFVGNVDYSATADDLVRVSIFLTQNQVYL